MTTVAEFLISRLDDDSAWVEQFGRLSSGWLDSRGVDTSSLRPDDVRRMRADIAAKRRIVEGMSATAEVEGGGYENALHEALRLLATPYADHPDYDREWSA